VTPEDREQLGEWMGHIQDELRQQNASLARILSILQAREGNDEALRADHQALSGQVSDLERRVASITR
jgi:hypothetical protein